jgi:single-strand selective monofunctional uracil DNA glycosylase
MVREFLGIEGPVKRPNDQHDKRTIFGFECQRREVSGTRLWGWAQARFGSCDAFFQRFFVVNYCPLVFLEASGKNRTPDRLPASERSALFSACSAALREVVELLAPRRVVGIGAFAEKRAREALSGLDLPVSSILHPSPASPAANRGWAQQVEVQLEAAGVALP